MDRPLSSWVLTGHRVSLTITFNLRIPRTTLTKSSCICHVCHNLFRNIHQYLLIVQDDIRHPNHLWRDSNRRHIVKLGGVPAQFIIVPFLQDPKQLTLHSIYTFYQFLHSLGVKPMILAFLCFTVSYRKANLNNVNKWNLILKSYHNYYTVYVQILYLIYFKESAFIDVHFAKSHAFLLACDSSKLTQLLDFLS